MSVRLDEQARLSLERLLPRLETTLKAIPDRDIFLQRVDEHFIDAFAMFYQLYSGHYDFFYHLEQTLLATAEAFAERSAELKALDTQRAAEPEWFQSQNMLGGVCYVDLFAENLKGIRERIPYFEELGLTFLYLMPLFRTPKANSDGGYAVSSFREVQPSLGTMSELRVLARTLREHGVSLCLDFVFNHTADEHEWAQRALSGDPRYQDFYYMFEDRTIPDHNFQWDLNYANPEVFSAVLREMLFIANQGVEVLRLDAVPFIWKEQDTPSENLPQTHCIIHGFNAFVRMATPALLFNSEAIVHPTNVRSYIDPKECQISYNPILMSSIWEALATRSVDFFRYTMNKQFPLPPGCAWLNYLRSHDDIGWGFSDEDAGEIGINSADHRYFLNLFFLGRYPGSFAAGLPFSFNPRTQDMRISGTTASLSGLEKANKLDDAVYRDAAIRRIIMLHSIILSVGGIPLIYLGDEIGTLNDYSYRENPVKAADSRWVQRSQADAKKYELRHDPARSEGKIFAALLDLIALRKQIPVLADTETYFVFTGNSHVLGYTRHNSMLVLANFSEFPQQVDVSVLQNAWYPVRETVDLITSRPVVGNTVHLEPYQFMWLTQPE